MALAASVAALLCFYGAWRVSDERHTDRVARFYLHETEPVFLEIWHADSFEGGTGSRGAWLAARCAEYERRHRGVYVRVRVLPVETVKSELAAGRKPDILSCGGGVIGAEAVTNHGTDTGALLEGLASDERALPYAFGGYFFFGRDGVMEKEEINALLPSLTGSRRTRNGTISVPACASSAETAEKLGIRADSLHRTALDAYAAFIAGNANSLLGTQRDIYRLAARESDVPVAVITDGGVISTDLVQYLYFFGESTESRDLASYILSENVQKKLSAVGLVSVRADVKLYGGALGVFEEIANRGVKTGKIFT